MNNIHLITYATHSEGTFDELVNNKFNTPIKVLGWGKKWNGFMDKFKNMYEYIQTLPDNDIIIFIDGFDSKINQPINIIKKKFLEFNSDIVISEQDYIPYIGHYTWQKQLFHTCKNNNIANSGLYGGYNKNIKDLLKFILDKNYSDDDQRNLNNACKYFNNIIIDTNRKLFHNLNYYERIFNNNSNSCIISTPAKLTFNRLIRMPKEYIPLIWKKLLFIIIIILVLIYYFKFNN